MYHATFVAHLPSIFKYGLVPGTFKNYEVSSSDYSYLCEDPDLALKFVEDSLDTALVTEDVYYSGFAIIEVDVRGLKLELDPGVWDEDDPSLFKRTKNTIPISKLRLIRVCSNHIENELNGCWEVT